MKLFGEKVLNSFTNSSFNILQVENFSEIFFDVYEIELNGVKYPVEKVSEYKGNPVVSVPVVEEDQEIMFPFVLVKGRSNIIFNEHNTEIPVDDYVPDIITEDVVEERLQESKQEILDQIHLAKENAKKFAIRAKKQKLSEANQEIVERKKVLERTLQNAREELVDEFLNISNNIKKELIDENDNRFGEISQTIDNKITDLSSNLLESLKKDFNKSSEIFDNQIKTLIKEMYESLSPKIDRGMESIATDIVEKVAVIEKDLTDKLKDKADKTLIENVEGELNAVSKANIELNDKINKGVNKALSRVGNADKKIDELTIALSEEVENKISKSEENITNYYTEKLKMLEEKTFDITEETRKYIVELVTESRNNLVSEIRKIKDEKPVEYIVESKGKKQSINSDDLVKDFDKKINTKIDNEVTRLRKYISVYSGGGSVAMQFADGGTMNGDLNVNGNLTVFGAISANQFLGLPTDLVGSDVSSLSANWQNTYTTVQANSATWVTPPLNYLPLSGGTLTGSLSATTLTLSGNATIGRSNTVPVYIGVASNLSTYSGVWMTNSTPTTSNYAFLYGANQTLFNTVAGGAMSFRVGNSSAIDINSSHNVGIGVTPSARLHTISTTEQLRVGYDTNNYWNATTSSTGVTTLSAVGSGAKFVFGNNVEVTAAGGVAGSTVKIGGVGMNLGFAAGGSSYSGVWCNQAVPSFSNYTFLGDGADSFFNAAAAGKNYFRTGNLTKMMVDTNGVFIPGISPNANPTTQQLTVIPSLSSKIGVVVKGAPSQTANLQEWQDTNGVVLGRVNASGGAQFTNATIPDVVGDTSFADDVEVLGEMTVTGQPAIGALGDNHVTTKLLADYEAMINGNEFRQFYLFTSQQTGSGSSGGAYNIVGMQATVNTALSGSASAYTYDGVLTHSGYSGGTMRNDVLFDMFFHGVMFRVEANTNWVLRINFGVGTATRVPPAAGVAAASSRQWGVEFYYDGADYVGRMYWYDTSMNYGTPFTIPTITAANWPNLVYSIRMRQTTLGLLEFYINTPTVGYDGGRLSDTPTASMQATWTSSFYGGRSINFEAANRNDAAATQVRIHTNTMYGRVKRT